MSDRAEPVVEDGRIEWSFDVPLLTSRFMLWDFLRVTLISVATMYVLVAITGWIVEGEAVLLPWFVLPLVTAVMLGLFGLASLLLGNRHGARFGVAPSGVTYEAELRERRINRAVVILGALAGNPTATGAGLLASSSEMMRVPWSEIHRVVYYPDPHVIVIRNSWRAVLRLHLPVELYDQTAALVDSYWRGAAPSREKASGGRVVRAPWGYYAALSLAVAVATAGANVWYWNDYELSARMGLIGSLCLLVAVIAEGAPRRILGFLSIPLLAWHLGAIVFSALGTVEDSVFGTWYVASLDPAELAVSVLALVVLLGIASWRTFGPQR